MNEDTCCTQDTEFMDMQNLLRSKLNPAPMINSDLRSCPPSTAEMIRQILPSTPAFQEVIFPQRVKTTPPCLDFYQRLQYLVSQTQET